MKKEDVPAHARRCLVEGLKETVYRCGGKSLEDNGLLLVAVDDPCPVLVNSALRTETPGATDVLERAEHFFREQGHPFELWTQVGADGDLEIAARAANMRIAAELAGMIIDSSPRLPELSREVELRQVDGADSLRDFVNVLAEGFRDEARGMSSLVRTVFSESNSLLARDTAAFVAWDQGHPSAAAMTMVKGSCAWIGWVATIPKARGRGLGRLVTSAAVQAGFALGAQFASLEATKMGAPVYRRIGFREVLQYRTYWPAEFRA